MSAKQACSSINLYSQPPFRYAIKSERSFCEPIPANAIPLPGAKLAGDASHLSKFASDHLRVAFDDKAPEYENPSTDAILLPATAPRAGPTELA